MLIKGTIHQEEITILNMYASCIGAPNLIMQLLVVKKQINPDVIIMNDFNDPLSPTYSIAVQNLEKK